MNAQDCKFEELQVSEAVSLAMPGLDFFSPAPSRPAGSVGKVHAAGSEGFGLGLPHGNHMLRSDPLDPVHLCKPSLDLARQTPANMTSRVYARSRWERRGELAEAVGHRVDSGSKSEGDY